MTRRRATEALSKTLMSAGFPSTGWVAQVKLIRLGHEDAAYLRGFPVSTAVYNGTVIQWS